MKILDPSRLAVLLAGMTLAGCAGSTASYPSLAPRPVEQPATATTDEPPPTAVDAGITARTEAILARARQGEAAFQAAVARHCAAIGRGRNASQGTEAWVAAQQALSAVEAERQVTAQALGDIQTIVLEQSRQAEDAARPVDLNPLVTAATTIGALDDAQTTRLLAVREGRCAG